MTRIMTIPRRQQFDATQPTWLHCTSRCVRRAFLAGDGYAHRKEWIEERLHLLARCFAVEIAAYAVMSNHLHVVLRMRPDQSAEWDDVAIAKRWLSIYPRQYLSDGTPVLPSDDTIARIAQQKLLITRWRTRLCDVGWCMKALKEPIARRANREDGCTGTFWERRYHSAVLLDQAALIACMAYCDLNPIRAKIVDRPEHAQHTSVYQRIRARNRHRAAEKIKDRDSIKADRILTKVGLAIGAAHPEDGLWLTALPNCIVGEPLANKRFTLQDYLTLVDHTGRLLKHGKRGHIPSELAPILQRLDLSVDSWIATMLGWRMFAIGTALGHAASRTTAKLANGVKWLRNRCPIFNNNPRVDAKSA